MPARCARTPRRRSTAVRCRRSRRRGRCHRRVVATAAHLPAAAPAKICGAQFARLDLVEEIVGRIANRARPPAARDRLVQPHEIAGLEELPQGRLVGAARPRAPQIRRRLPIRMQPLEPAGLHLDAVGTLLSRIFAQRGLVDRTGAGNADRRHKCDAGCEERRNAHCDVHGAHSCRHDGYLIFTATSDSSCSVEE